MFKALAYYFNYMLINQAVVQNGPFPPVPDKAAAAQIAQLMADRRFGDFEKGRQIADAHLLLPQSHQYFNSARIGEGLEELGQCIKFAICQTAVFGSPYFFHVDNSSITPVFRLHRLIHPASILYEYLLIHYQRIIACQERDAFFQGTGTIQPVSQPFLLQVDAKTAMPDTISADTGTLYVVATPIGNLEDITLRALRILKEVDFVAAEDTRHSKKLFNHFDIRTRLISYYREQEQQKAEQLIRLLTEGKNIALITDAGTPAISDPGSVIVQRALEAGIKTTPVPGPSALTAALSCAGTSEAPIMFHGFAPAKSSQRRQLFKTLIHADYHTVFYESPHRVETFVAEALEVLGDRQILLARELTKAFEEVAFFSLGSLKEHLAKTKNRGEYVLVISPAGTTPDDDLNLDELICWYRDNTRLSLKDSCKTLAADLGLPRSGIYKRALQIWDAGPEDD